MKIIRAAPIEYYDIILEFEDGSLKKFSRNIVKTSTHYGFLSFPNKLKAFRTTTENLIWYNGVELGADFLFTYSIPVNRSEITQSYLTLGSRNNAPTSQDERHHVFYTCVNPFKPEKPITLGESIHGGLGESGGQTALSIDALFAWKEDWEHHLRKSDCEWAIEIIKTNKDNAQLLIDKLVEAVCKQHFTTVKD
jgi:hypothetical protein